MHHHHRIPHSLWLLSALLCLASCVAPSTPYAGRDAQRLGHKPGPQGFRTVILDAGHGGKDSGAVRNGLREKDYALDMVQRLQRHLSGAFRVKLVRSGDNFVDLDRRAATPGTSADAVMVSVHFNSGPARLSGAETFYWRVDSYGLAKRLQNAMSSVTPGHNSRGLTRRRLRMTRNPSVPCVLIECGYLSNRREANAIRQVSYRERLVSAIAQAILDQSKHGDGNCGPLPPARYDPPSSAHDARDRW